MPAPPLLRSLMLACLVPLAASALAQQGGTAAGLDRNDAFSASQAALGRRIGEHTLLDRAAQPVRLSAWRGKPLLVSFIYTGCFQQCPASTQALREAASQLRARFGAERFNVLSIGFNQPADSPTAMKAFAAQQRIDAPNWDFLSLPAAGVGPLTQEFGFRWASTPAGIDHVLQISLLDAQGRVVRQFYGERPAAAELDSAMAQLLAGAELPPPSALAELVDRVRLLCSVYDPETGTYRVDYSLLWEIAGGVTFMLAMALYMLNEWRERRRQRRGAPRDTRREPLRA